MIYLLPICIYEAKVMLQTNTYFKVQNRPKAMMRSNIDALLFGIVISAIFVYYFESVSLAIVAMPLTIFLQYVFSLKRLRPTSYKKDLENILPESLLISLFVITNIIVPNKSLAIVVYVVAISIYILYYKRLIKDTLNITLQWISKKNFLNHVS